MVGAPADVTFSHAVQKINAEIDKLPENEDLKFIKQVLTFTQKNFSTVYSSKGWPAHCLLDPKGRFLFNTCINIITVRRSEELANEKNLSKIQEDISTSKKLMNNFDDSNIQLRRNDLNSDYLELE